MQQLVLERMEVATLDIVIVVAYLLLILVAGILLSRRASKDLDSYFLGGRKLPWWLLGLSGTACYFDVSGVMWTIALFYIMGQQFLWPQFMWGYVAMMACFATFMGKWLRRSEVLTGAEWMVFRFGTGAAGEFARAAYAVMAVVIAVAFTGFAEYGSGSFLEIFIPVPEDLTSTWWGQHWRHVLAIGLMALTTVYTISSGLLGVGVTGFIQFVLILIGSTVLIVQAIRMGSYEAVAAEVPREWFTFAPPWNWPRLAEWELTAAWVAFVPLTITWFIKGAALGIGGPQQLYDLQRFLAARTPREASLAGMIWGVGLVPMFMVSAAVGVIGLAKWGGEIENPDQLYPMVVGTLLPVGLKGLVLAGLLSAFMSTFSATINAGASYLTFDLYHKYLAPSASERQLVRASRVCSLLIVIAGILVGMAARDINTIFEWIMMVLGAGVLVPNVLRWFWWRFNGVGFAVGTLAGVVAAMALATLSPQTPGDVTFPILLAISAGSSVLASLCTQPTDANVLAEFFRRVRPAGWWGPVRRAVAETQLPHHESFAWDASAAMVTAIGLQALYSMSTYAVTHQWMALGASLAVLAACTVVLYFIWYRRLPLADEGAAEALS